ncbi:unnamed protein product [Linum tenue]|uniref:Uncharacterized protein n=1 Tax=Linum tenue TaxID=586396 RepID=A0AAV0NX82_9ROSI|nr:unnamed protein product [Linum tenue]
MQNPLCRWTGNNKHFALLDDSAFINPPRLARRGKKGGSNSIWS